jgi:aspartyl-tRNA(Asn)/glutamyl-tRNA(Gln) amidotransferase subunit C
MKFQAIVPSPKLIYEGVILSVAKDLRFQRGDAPSGISLKMTQTERVTSKDLQRVADLANLELSDNEQLSLLRDLNSILDHVAQLNELDTSAVPAMAQVGEAIAAPLHSNGFDSRATLRPDLHAPSLDRQLVLAAAPDSDHTYFLVPKVIER